MNIKGLFFLSVPVGSAVISFLTILGMVLTGNAHATEVERFATIAWAVFGFLMLFLIVAGTNWLGQEETWFTVFEGTMFTILVIASSFAAIVQGNILVILWNVVIFLITIFVWARVAYLNHILKESLKSDQRESEEFAIEQMRKANRPEAPMIEFIRKMNRSE